MSKTAQEKLPPDPNGLRPGHIKSRLGLMMFLQYFVQGCYLPIASVSGVRARAIVPFECSVYRPFPNCKDRPLSRGALRRVSRVAGTVTLIK